MEIKKLDCGCEYKVEDNVEIRLKTCDFHMSKIDISILKQQKINEIKNKTKEIILSRYSENMQRNIDALRLNTDTELKYTSTDRTNMWNWIDDIRLQGKNFQNTLNNLTILEDIQNFNFKFIIGD